MQRRVIESFTTRGRAKAKLEVIASTGHDVVWDKDGESFTDYRGTGMVHPEDYPLVHYWIEQREG